MASDTHHAHVAIVQQYFDQVHHCAIGNFSLDVQDPAARHFLGAGSRGIGVCRVRELQTNW